jgi:hypothetical protein
MQKSGKERFWMSERIESGKRTLLGEFAKQFLKAAGYSNADIVGLGDLSRVDPSRIKEMLHVKVEEAKKIDWLKKNPPPFRRLDEKF